MKWMNVIIVCFLLLAGCDKKDPASSTGGSDLDGKILFLSTRNSYGSSHIELGERSDIYMMNGDGSNQKQLTEYGLWITFPQFTPDGSEIIYSIYEEWQVSRLVSMDSDGHDYIDLTDPETGSKRFCISPDGENIVYESQSTLWQMNHSGKNKKALIEWSANLQNTGQDFPIQYSNDGSFILFISTRDGDYDIYRANADGSNIQNLTQNVWYDLTCILSPDDSRIVFTSYQNAKTHLYAMNPDGTDQQPLTQTGAWNADPSFSPDGQKIAFVSSRNGYNEVYVMDKDGSHQTCLTDLKARTESPIFSSDGNYILFELHSGEEVQLYLIHVDGGDPVQLTKTGNNYSAMFPPE